MNNMRETSKSQRTSNTRETTTNINSSRYNGPKTIRKNRRTGTCIFTAFIISVMILGVGLTMTGCGGSGAGSSGSDKGKTKITFVLDWTPNTNHTGIYIAKANGYFDEAGLDVEIVQPPENGVEAVVGSGEAQMGVSFQDYMAPILQGNKKQMPITAVAAILQHNLSGIMSAKGNGITSPKGLEGKTYATWEMPIEQAILKDCVEVDGGDFSKVKMVPEVIDDEVAALKSRKVDSIWVYYGWAGINAEVQGFPIDYFAFRDIEPAFDYYSPVIIANDDFLKNEPEAAKAFLKAATRGYEEAMENPKTGANILLQENPELDADLVLDSQVYLTDYYKAKAPRWGEIDGDRWNAFYRWLNDKGLTEEKIPDDVGFTNEYLPK